MYSEVLQQQIKNEQRMLQARIDKQAKITLQNIQIYRRILEQKTTFRTGELGHNSSKNLGLAQQSFQQRRFKSQSDSRMKHLSLNQSKNTNGELTSLPKMNVNPQNSSSGMDQSPLIKVKNLTVENTRGGLVTSLLAKKHRMEVRNVSQNKINDFKSSLLYCERPNELRSSKQESPKPRSLNRSNYERLGHLFHEKKLRPSPPPTKNISVLLRNNSKYDTSQLGSSSLHSSYPTPKRSEHSDIERVRYLHMTENKDGFKQENRWMFDHAASRVYDAQNGMLRVKGVAGSTPLTFGVGFGKSDQHDQQSSFSGVSPMQPHSMILGLDLKDTQKPLALFKKYKRTSAEIGMT